MSVHPTPRPDVRPAPSGPRRTASRVEGNLGGLRYEAGLAVSELIPPTPPPTESAAAADPRPPADVAGWESAGTTSDRGPR